MNTSRCGSAREALARSMSTASPLGVRTAFTATTATTTAGAFALRPEVLHGVTDVRISCVGHRSLTHGGGYITTSPTSL